MELFWLGLQIVLLLDLNLAAYILTLKVFSDHDFLFTFGVFRYKGH